MKEINCTHHALCLNFYFCTVSCCLKKSSTTEQFWFVSVTLLKFLLNIKLIAKWFFPSIFLAGSLARKKLSTHFVGECSLTIMVAAGIWADSLAPFSQSKCQKSNIPSPVFNIRQILFTSSIRTVWSTHRRMGIFISGPKGLIPGVLVYSVFLPDLC